MTETQKSMLALRTTTPAGWLQKVLANFDEFLLDHASCERKASALGMSLICHYPDRTRLVEAMVPFAQEELTHFAQVTDIIHKRGLRLRGDEKDPYVVAMTKLCRKGSENYFLDRLIIAGIIEARGCERFALLADALEGDLGRFYADITRSEARHHGLFLRLARVYFADTVVDERLAELLDAEAPIMRAQPFSARMH